jgi:hypothetical protein
MNAALISVFKKLEEGREQLLISIAHLSPDQYQRSVDGKWSVSQILTHLLTSERIALVYMKKKSLGVAMLRNSGWLEAVKLLLLQASQRLPVRYKAPQPIVDQTPSALTFSELKNQWRTCRMELKNFLETIDEQNVRKMIFKHPVAGRFNALQGMTFLHEHMLHHLPQIKRLL